MMKSKLLLLLLIAGMAGSATAQTNRELDELLKKLEQLAETRAQSKDAALRKILPEVEKAASTGGYSVGAYADAYRSIELAGRTALAADFAAWRETNRDVLNSNDFRAAAQLHAEYLVLTLKRSNSEKPEEFIQPSLDYLKSLEDAWSKVFSRQDKPSPMQKQLLEGNVREGLMAKHWDLAAFLPDLRDWEFVPGNAEGILDKNIRPLLRKENDKRIVDTWDWQMKFEESKFSPRDRSHAVEMFKNRRLPALKMRQAEDRAATGDPLRAARDAVVVLTQHPEHPSFDQWVENVRKWLDAARKLPAETPTDAPPEEQPAAVETPAQS
jgi:hypothetical protein